MRLLLILTRYDILARHQARIGLRVSLTQDTVKFSELSVKQLQQAAVVVQKTKQMNYGFSDPIALQFFKTISASCRSLKHSPEHCFGGRRRVQGMNFYFGRAQLFLTLSHDDIGRIHIHQGCHMNRQEKMEFLKRDAVSAPTDFKVLLETFIKKVLNGGVFGHTEAYAISIEEQNRKALHLHSIVWNPDVRKLIQTALQGNTQPFEKYIDEHIDEELTIDIPPTTTTLDLNLSATTRELQRLFIFYGLGRFPDTKDEQDAFRRKFVEQTSSDPTKERLRHAAVQYMTTMHTHSESCGTTRKPNECRFKFPRPVHEKTKVEVQDGELIVQIRKSAGNEWYGSTNNQIMKLFASNHDVRFITNNSINQYITKYVTKSNWNNQAVFAAALYSVIKRIQTREIAPTNEDEKSLCGFKRLVSALLAKTNTDVIGSPMAAHFLLGGEKFYFSHSFEPLLLSQAEKFLIGDPVSGMLSRSKNHFVIYYSIWDYIHRPDSLEHLCFYRFVSLFKRYPKNNAYHQFRASHPYSEKYSIKEQMSIPYIIGKIPNRDNLVTFEDKEEYARKVVALVVPFRSRESLRGNNFQEIMENEKNHFDKERALLENIQMQYEKKQQEVSSLMGDDDERNDNPQNEDSDPPYEDDLEHDDYLQNMTECASTFDMDMDENLTTKLPPSVTQFLDSYSIEATHRLTLTPDFVHDYSEQFQRIQLVSAREYEDEDKVKFEDKKFINNVSLEHRSRWIVSVCAASSALALVNQASNSVSFATIEDVIFKFNLNTEQSIAFKIMCGAFCQSIHKESMSQNLSILIDAFFQTIDNKSTSERQLIMLLTGAAGSGKSLVIAAFRYFVEFISGETDGSVVICATTGQAATLISGQTVHSYLGFHPSRNARKLSQKDKEKFAVLKLLIIDEVSMLSKKLINMIDIKLRAAKESPDLYFGGVHIIFTGDFSQLPPVQATPLFRKPSTNETKSPQSISGGILWVNAINCCIKLKATHRFSDKKFGDILGRFRGGTVTANDLQTINSQYQHHVPQNSQNPIIVPDNATRYAITKQIMTKLNKTGRTLRIFASFRDVTTEESHFMYYNMTEAECKHMLPYLDVYPNMPLILTKNICVKHKLANGTSVIFDKVILKQDRETKKIITPDCGEITSVMASDILMLKVRLKDFPHQKTTEDLLPGEAVIFTRNETITYKAKKTILTQFPLVPAFALTGHKCQGKTFDDVVITSFANTTGWSYVALSRARALDKIVLLSKLSEVVAKYSTPDDLRDEESKHQVMHISTLEKVMEATRTMEVKKSVINSCLLQIQKIISISTEVPVAELYVAFWTGGLSAMKFVLSNWITTPNVSPLQYHDVMQIIDKMML